ncbi:MAG: hypothetical protein IKP09_10495 [Lentisphaeria bacterium]|jgi:hypothetical protein|nr:hypothetical protein [Lentisphaeria bacterium]
MAVKSFRFFGIFQLNIQRIPAKINSSASFFPLFLIFPRLPGFSGPRAFEKTVFYAIVPVETRFDPVHPPTGVFPP